MRACRKIEPGRPSRAPLAARAKPTDQTRGRQAAAAGVWTRTGCDSVALVAKSVPRFASLLLGLFACSGGGDHPASIGDSPDPPVAPAPSDAPVAPPGTGLRYSVGDTLDSALSWRGFADGGSEASQIAVSDYLDTTGSRGINALLITEGTTVCPACLLEAKDLPGRLSGPWGKLGVKVVQLLVQDSAGAGATTITAEQWRKATQASWAVAADPGFTFARAGSNPFPVQILVNPRTLRIVARFDGYHATLPEVDALAESNQP